MSSDQQNKPSDELCPAGRILKVEFDSGIDRVEDIANRLEKSLDSMTKTMFGNSKEITTSVQKLVEYSIRDKEKIEALEEKSRCKKKALKELEDDKQKLEIGFAKHLGEHAVERRIERKLAVASGMGGATGFVGIWEFIKYLFKAGS